MTSRARTNRAPSCQSDLPPTAVADSWLADRTVEVQLLGDVADRGLGPGVDELSDQQRRFAEVQVVRGLPRKARIRHSDYPASLLAAALLIGAGVH